MPIVKKQDWKGWLDGMRSKSFKAGGEAIATQLTALLASNGVASMGISALADVGLNWKQLVSLMVIQFVVRVGLAAAIYVQNKPDPDVITETIETQHITRDAAGIIESGSSVTTTTTPVEPVEQDKTMPETKP